MGGRIKRKNAVGSKASKRSKPERRPRRMIADMNPAKMFWRVKGSEAKIN